MTDTKTNNNHNKEIKKKKQGGRGGGYDTNLWFEALKEIETPADTGTIHKKVSKDIGFEPSEKTTQNKLHKLVEKGKIKKRKLGGNYIWNIKQKPYKQDIYNLIKKLGVATTQEIIKKSEGKKENIKKILKELKKEQKIESKTIGENLNKKVWYIP